MKTEILKRGAAQFDMCGQFLGYPLKELHEEISPGLAKRLAKYASTRAVQAGLQHLLDGWQVTVYTMDGDSRPSERGYNVAWDNAEGTRIEICRILTRDGWPFIDHGFSMST